MQTKATDIKAGDILFLAGHRRTVKRVWRDGNSVGILICRLPGYRFDNTEYVHHTREYDVVDTAEAILARAAEGPAETIDPEALEAKYL